MQGKAEHYFLPVYNARTINPEVISPITINPTTIATITKQQKVKKYPLQKIDHT